MINIDLTPTEATIVLNALESRIMHQAMSNRRRERPSDVAEENVANKIRTAMHAALDVGGPS